MNKSKLSLITVILFGIILGNQFEWKLNEQIIFPKSVRFVKSKATSESQARQPEYLITNRVDFVSKNIIEMSVLAVNSSELFNLDINAEMGDYYDGIYTTLVDPVPNAYEIYDSPALNIYHFDGSLISSTVFDDEKTQLISVFGKGQYIGFNRFNGSLHIVNPEKGLYEKYTIIEKEEKQGGDRYYIESTAYKYHSPTGQFYFLLGIDNEAYSILTNDNCELLWAIAYDQRVSRQTFSDNGNYISLFIGKTPTSSYGDLIIIDQSGEQVSRISGIRAGGYPIEIFEDYDILVVHDDQKTWICSYKTGAIIHEYPVGGRYMTYCPTKNYIIKVKSRANQIILSLYDINESRRIRSISSYQLETPAAIIPINILDVSISYDGSQVSLVTNTMFYKIELKEN